MIEVKKTDVVILNWLRPNNIKEKIIPILLESKFINNIIVSHGRLDTYFEYKDERVISLDHSQFNKKYGLALRFICKDYLKMESVLILDDDILIKKKHVDDLVKKYIEKPDFIHGYYGRIVSNNIIPYGLVNEKGFIVDSMIKYIPINAFSLLIHKKRVENNIALTKMMIIPLECYELFNDYCDKINPFMKKKSSPLWNGEDITINLLWMKKKGTAGN